MSGVISNSSSLLNNLFGLFSKPVKVGVQEHNVFAPIIRLNRMDSLEDSDTFVLDYISENTLNARNSGWRYISEQDWRYIALNSEYIMSEMGGSLLDAYLERTKMLNTMAKVDFIYEPVDQDLSQPLPRVGYSVSSVTAEKVYTYVFLQISPEDEELVLYESRGGVPEEVLRIQEFPRNVRGLNSITYLIIQVTSDITSSGDLAYVDTVSKFQSFPIRNPYDDTEGSIEKPNSAMFTDLLDSLSEVVSEDQGSFIVDTGFVVTDYKKLNISGVEDTPLISLWLPNVEFYAKGTIVTYQGLIYISTIDVNFPCNPGLDISGVWAEIN